MRSVIKAMQRARDHGTISLINDWAGAGRVTRGEKEGYCILPSSETSSHHLKAYACINTIRS